ncbi:MAG: HAD family hydrolase [Clostridia bacterium]|nr:HAD family hydrolase [Clostridia bacterium]
MKKLCVFDLDGTLVDSIYDIAAAMNASLEIMGKPTYSTEAYYQMVGDGMELLCRRAIPGGTDAEVRTLIGLYKERYLQNCCVLTRPYAGVPELLQCLSKKQILTAVLSNKPHEQTKEVVSTLLGEVNFFAVIGQSERFPKKPDPTALNFLIAQAGVTKTEVCYIGDSNVDMELGKACGVATIGAAWGFRGETELKNAGAGAIVHHADELKTLLLGS